MAVLSETRRGLQQAGIEVIIVEPTAHVCETYNRLRDKR
jgi:hypothetical protein